MYNQLKFYIKFNFDSKNSMMKLDEEVTQLKEHPSFSFLLWYFTCVIYEGGSRPFTDFFAVLERLSGVRTKGKGEKVEGCHRREKNPFII